MDNFVEEPKYRTIISGRYRAADIIKKYLRPVRENSLRKAIKKTAKALVPVEVKATNGRAKSLRTLIASDKYPDITYGIKLIKGNIGIEKSIRTFPYFCAFLLKCYMGG